MFIRKIGEKSKQTVTPLKRFVETVFIPLCVFVISLGSFSEAFILVDDFFSMLKSKYSNENEYETLAKINVGNTVVYIEDLVGAPAATKAIGEDINVNYYIDDKYLLTTYVKGERVSAYTVVALSDGFSPNMDWSNNMPLGAAALAKYSEQAASYALDNANTNRYFIELTPNELSGFFQNTYLGAVQYGVGTVSPDELSTLYQSEVYGTEEETIKLITRYRALAKPNFYGQGELELTQIQSGLLSNGEFLNFFGK